MAGLALLAFFAVVDRQQNKIADLEILVPHFRSDSSHRPSTFVTENCRILADLDFSLLEHEVLALGLSEQNDLV